MDKMKRAGGVRKIVHRLTRDETDGGPSPNMLKKAGFPPRPEEKPHGSSSSSSSNNNNNNPPLRPSSLKPKGGGAAGAEKKKRVTMNLTPSNNSSSNSRHHRGGKSTMTNNNNGGEEDDDGVARKKKSVTIKLEPDVVAIGASSKRGRHSANDINLDDINLEDTHDERHEEDRSESTHSIQVMGHEAHVDMPMMLRTTTTTSGVDDDDDDRVDNNNHDDDVDDDDDNVVPPDNNGGRGERCSVLSRMSSDDYVDVAALCGGGDGRTESIRLTDDDFFDGGGDDEDDDDGNNNGASFSVDQLSGSREPRKKAFDERMSSSDPVMLPSNSNGINGGGPEKQPHGIGIRTVAKMKRLSLGAHRRRDAKNRFTVAADDSFGELDDRTVRDRTGGRRGREGGLADYPEVEMLLTELNRRVAALESIVSEGLDRSKSDGDYDYGGGAAQDPEEPVTVTMTRDQKEALAGLGSNVKGLMRCLDHRHREQQKMILLYADGDEDSDREEGIGSGGGGGDLTKSLTLPSGQFSQDAAESAIRAAKRRTKDGKRKKAALRSTVYSTNKGMRDTNDDNRRPSASSSSSVIPRELIQNLKDGSDNDRNDQVLFSAAYIAHEYGGVELPRRFTICHANNNNNNGSNITAVNNKRRSMKAFARAVSDANAFVGEAKASGNVGKDELEYLPLEFARLEPADRERLAKLLSWESLRDWGFDSFEVDELSAVTLFRKTVLGRGCSAGSGGSKNNGGNHPIELAGSLLSEDGNWSDNDIDTAFGRGTSGGSEKDEEGVESIKRGCPVVLIGWAILASPYSQLAMAKNVNDAELVEVAMKAIRQRANTASGNMAKRILQGESPVSGACADASSAAVGGDSSSSSNKEEDNEDPWNGGYFLPDIFEVSPRSISRFLRKVEKEYKPRSVNPYHNNIHAADVIQSTHALIQMGGEGMEMAYTPLETYSILIAAALHDVRHPGTNNNYQVNKRTGWSLIYNDASVLENMHASRACHLLEGVDHTDISNNVRSESEGGFGNVSISSLNYGNNIVNEEPGGSGRETPRILGTMSKEQQTAFRTSMIKSILSTDMSRHFSECAKISNRVKDLEDEIAELSEQQSPPLSSLGEGSLPSPPPPPPSFLSKIGGDKHVKLRGKFLPFLLHLADISNPTKSQKISVGWADCVYKEFFLQGDKERMEDMPISPLCDRSTTSMPEAQVGFMQFVIKPSFDLLARCIPKVEGVVVSQLEDNMRYWEGEKAKQSKEREEEEELRKQ